ncbi:family 78 glycoside hydrolase catalytic domain [Lactiplantibacillus mudanjiangensis]|uniref:alpha-L-rhamnosidase n=1 Tax=Lactiplantibacillus mudanjiangensis TaxID=1296538 RepID=A0A660E4K6_9LACO|nr:family 78 glycoside hydrolase catalytic domain [Lactiplantibacillus mudanjiangensis]VDG22509.1 alpha-L-rhamnosidase [Lactobacillus apis] [Lactiplantibacillus mudanjiangensis]VDG26942.1 alpha-L-rhamnosidase [Lactobacillus apis] [Lactiplantibacillus mudanjiangensis]
MQIKTVMINGLSAGHDEIIVSNQDLTFNWIVESQRQNDGQVAYELNIKTIDGALIYQSGIQQWTETRVKLTGVMLPPQQQFCWQVRVLNRFSEWSLWSPSMVFTTAIDHWQARWIEPVQPTVTEEAELDLAAMFGGAPLPPQSSPDKRLRPVQYLRRDFKLAKPVKRAQLMMTAHGVYQPLINGQKITTAQFMPDFTSYQHLLQYQCYDVTRFLGPTNHWDVLLADGWYAGRISTTGNGAQFGNQLGILGELIVTFTDDTQVIIGTDEQFYSTTGKYNYSDIFIGEKQDLRRQTDWQHAQPVNVVDEPMTALVPQLSQYVRRLKPLQAIKVWHDGADLLVDFGQVIAGRTIIKTFLAAGQTLKVEHAEVLDQAGHFFNNITGRNKDQVDYFIGRGRFETLEADFTFHGFRYVRLTGLETVPELADLQAVPLMTAMPETGQLTTSAPKINQLIKNVQWSQRGNMLSIPTDCPQRERAGWTGDTQVFAPTAMFNYDAQTMLNRWLADVRAEQRTDGQIIDYSPAPKEFYTSSPQFTGTYSSAGWGDAIIMVPWTLYQSSGDPTVLANNYAAMQRWHQYSVTSAAQDKPTTGPTQYIWDTKFHYGDWMFPSYMLGKDAKGPMATAAATQGLVGTAFLSYSSHLLAQAATTLGDDSMAAKYQEYADKVAAAFQATFWNRQQQQLTADFQGCYVLAVAFDLLDDETTTLAVERLVQLIKANDDCLDTGFLSVPYLLDVLDQHGYPDLAEKVLCQTKLPSWLYEVDHGATTIWESWGGIDQDGTVGSYSFNHYAFGCVEHWLVEHVGGLRCQAPGYRQFDVQIPIDSRFTHAELDYQSSAGQIKIQWRRQDAMTHIELQVPFNTQATVKIGNQVQQLGSGSYDMSYDGVTIKTDV